MTEEQNIADYIQSKLLEYGFKIQRYNAYSTNSIYLKLDYGVCNSIRISDHKGKAYLKYRYNIGKYVEEYVHTVDKFDRYYYSPAEIESLIAKIQDDRDKKIMRYGIDRYGKLMSKSRAENQTNKGFWRQAYVVNK